MKSTIDRRALEILDQVFDLPEDQVAEFVADACAGDDELRQRVGKLIQQMEQSGGALPPSPILDSAHQTEQVNAGDTLADRYTITETVGSGGMGDVYRALDLSLDRHVALKMLNPASQSSQEMRTRFEREMKSVARLSHPNIVTFHDTAIDGETRFAVMEFVVGETLRESISAELTWQETLPIARDIAAGLHAAHDQGIIHRDIKPENIMITPNGIAKILDFGIARSVSGQQEQTLTATSMTPGTIPYMSPEQIASGELSFATDIFSLGTVMYEMLSGKNPFREDSAFRTMENVTHESPCDISELVVDIPKALANLLMLMLQKRPLERPTAKEVEGELSTLIAGADSRLVARSARQKREQEIGYCKTADGVRIAYGITGEGPPLVKAANWMTHLTFEWDSPLWRPWVSELSRSHQLIRYDERGNGLSDHEVEDVSFDAMVADLEAVVDELELERFPLFGISQGCAVSIEYAVRHPERVTCLILYGGYAKGWLKAEEGSTDVAECIEATKTLMRANWGANNPSFRQMFTSQLFPKASAELMTWFNDLQLKSVSPENACRLYETICNIDVSKRVGLVKVPTLVLHAVHETFCDPELGRELAEFIPGAQFVELNSENHLLLEDEPAFPVFMHQLREFLAENGG